MIRLDAASFLLQWAAGGMLFLWVTTRQRRVGLGYGWLLRGVFAVFAVGAVAAGRFTNPDPARDGLAAATVLAICAALTVSIKRKGVGVRNQRLVEERRSARVAAMTGIDRAERTKDTHDEPTGAEFPPVLDLVAASVGLIACGAAAVDAGGPLWLSLLRMIVGALFIGSVSDAMLLGHWYLVQPGLERAPLFELLRWTTLAWPFEVVALLLPTGMISVLVGTVDDGWGGALGWFWAASAVTTIILYGVTHAALREKQYSAVMAATGLLYLAILTAFGTDLVARAVLSA